MSLPPEVRANYTTIIDSILAASDLTTISAKRIRKGLQESVQYDITPQKAAIKELILERFDIFNAKLNGAAATPNAVEQPPKDIINNGSHTSPKPVADPSPKRTAEPSDMSDAADGTPKKKRKPSLDADAVYAAKLQAEEDKLARPTRGGNSRKGAPVKKKSPTKKKTSARVKVSDDSDVEDTQTGEEKPQRTTGFHKPLILSPPLSELLGGDTMLSRPQSVKRLWQYIRENNLQDPKDKRQIICDPPMRAVFKQDKVHMFQMTKILSQNLYSPDE